MTKEQWDDAIMTVAVWVLLILTLVLATVADSRLDGHERRLETIENQVDIQPKETER